MTAKTAQVAERLYELLQCIDPARWRRDLEPAALEKLASVRSGVAQLVRHNRPSDVPDGIWPRLVELHSLLEEHWEGLSARAADTAERPQPAAWRELRAELLPAYESLAASLRSRAVVLPKIRPTNYWRNVFHVASGLFVLALIEHLLAPGQLIWASGASVVIAIVLEGGRRLWRGANQLTMKLTSRFAHPHEHHGISSSAWFALAIFTLAVLNLDIFGVVALYGGSVAAVVLGLGDPAAAIVGRRFGRTRLVGNRTLEGSLAFVLAGFLGSMGMLAIYYPSWGLAQMALVALAGAVAGAITELIAGRIDDNFAIPVAAGVAASLCGMALGI